MITNDRGIRSAVAMYRVSTRQQERREESLFNQEREVRAWATREGVTIVKEIKCAESARGALHLVGGVWQFNRRQGYANLIRELQQAPAASRPDAVLVDWADRWSRNLLEYVGIIQAFRQLGIRMLSIGDGDDLTDPKNALVVGLMALIGEQQLRVTSDKVKEARRSRRERKLWQGGLAPDGYRTHDPSCSGSVVVTRDGPDSQRSFKQRYCACRPDVLRRDPAREALIRIIWQLLESSPLSWQCLAETLNERGLRRPNGRPWRWNDLYRIGENPVYCGILATNRSYLDLRDGRRVRRRPLPEQQLDEAPGAIPEPYISPQTFWSIWKRRYNKQTRHLTRARNGASCELSGLLACPACDSLMTSTYNLSAKICGNGKPRKSPRKKYVYAVCPNASRWKATGTTRCANTQRVRVDRISQLVVERLARTVTLSDDAIIEAFELDRKADVDTKALGAERRTVVRTIDASENARHVLTRALATGQLSEDEYSTELFQFRVDLSSAKERLREIDAKLCQTQSRPDLERARSTVKWLSEKWGLLQVSERAEALRVLIDRVTYVPNGSTTIDDVVIVHAGAAFSGSAHFNRARCDALESNEQESLDVVSSRPPCDSRHDLCSALPG